MNKAKKIIIIVLSCVVVLGGIYFALRTLKQKNQNSKTAGVYAVSDIGYDASDMWDNSTLSGNVTVNSEQKVYVGKTQSVSEIKVTEGQSVKAGDVLLVYDTTANDLQLELQRSELELSRVSIIDAQRELEKLKATTPLEDIPTTEAPATPVATGSDAPQPDPDTDPDARYASDKRGIEESDRAERTGNQNNADTVRDCTGQASDGRDAERNR